MRYNHHWTLLDNNSHMSYYFSSKTKLKQYAKIKAWIIKRSYLDSDCFYVESYQYIPGNDQIKSHFHLEYNR